MISIRRKKRDYGQFNWYRFTLHFSGIGFGADLRILDPIKEALDFVVQRIDSLQKPRIPEDRQEYDAIVDDSCDYIEDLLGVAFVVCQRQITQIVSWTMALHDKVLKDGKKLTCVKRNKTDIMRLGLPLIRRTNVNPVQAIDAFANYFKHAAEWRTIDWSKLKDQSKRTADIIVALGAAPSSTGNFRAGARALGNRNFSDLDQFLKHLSNWQAAVFRIHRHELKILGLYK